MTQIRDAYLEAAASAAELLEDPAVAAAWHGPSVLKEFSVHGLAGHLGAQVHHVSRVLEAAGAEGADGAGGAGEPVSVVAFFAGARPFQADADADINVRIREGGEAAAAGGAQAVVDGVRSALGRQRAALRAEPAGRVVSFAGAALLLDDFLLTRMLEIVVHCDDLAVSADVAPPTFPPHVFEPVLDVLSRLAAHRHGQQAVLRALSRAERAPVTIAGI